MELIPFKKYIGCEDCLSQWADYCPFCKLKSSALRGLDGKSRKMKQYKFIEKVNETYYYIKIINNPPKKQNGKNFTEKVLDLRDYWRKRHSKRVVTLILNGHDAACGCCYTLSDLTFDHVIPLVEGGSNEISNGQILCYYCNQLKADKIINIKDLRKEYEILYKPKVEA